MPRTYKSALVALAVVAAGVSVQPSAAAADWTVFAGGSKPGSPETPYEYTRFYPANLAIHSGDTVEFLIRGNGSATGFHTITFLADGDTRPSLYRADEVPGYYNMPEAMFMPSACGHQGETACVMSNTTTHINSGIPPLMPSSSFTVTFDLPVGTYDYICAIHTNMAGSIEVVPDAQTIPDPGAIATAAQQQLADDTAAAEAVENDPGNVNPGFGFEGEQKVHFVKLGNATADTKVSVLRFMPESLTIEAGDGVRWVVDDHIVAEIHTVSFPEVLSGAFSPLPHGKAGFGFHPRCDFDDPLEGTPGIPGPWEVTPLPCPGHLEFGMAPWITQQDRAPGDIVLTPVTVHDSGILVPPAAADNFRSLPDADEELPQTFYASFPVPGTYTYECNIHSDPMVGSITVV